MNITLIFPPLGHGGRKVRSFPLAPPVLEHLAGLATHLRPHWDIRLINANVEDFDPDSLDADLVGITILTHQARWAYRTADALRARGIKVILGGPHPSVLPEEAAPHADSVLVGEAEGVLDELFRDFESGNLKPRYEGPFLPFEDVPFPRRDLLNGYIFHAFSTSRGCPYRCKFCATPRLHGSAVRYRPVDEVVRDIASFRHRMWFSTDADIWGPDVSRYIELFRRMSEEAPRIYWAGEGSLASVQHPRGEEMLKSARKSGLMQVWVGWESFSQETLRQYGATPKMRSGREDALKKIRDNGIDAVLFLMLGAKGEDMGEYQRVLELTDRLDITPHPVMVAPYPGTELYEEWGGELLYGDDWDYYDGMHSVVRQEGAGNNARDAALVDLWLELFTLPRMLGRIRKLSMRGFPLAHMASIMVQSALRKAFREYAGIGG
jgi:radical SAM superfamily enzyme YgiQ (UPF0313 family)